AKVVVYDRKNMIKGVKTAGFISIPFPNTPGGDDSFFCPMTLDADGSLPPSNNKNYVFYFTDAQWGAPYTCAIQIDAINVNWTTKTGSIASTATQSLATATFDSHFPQDATAFQGIDQPGGSSNYHSIDPLDGFFNYRIPYMRWTNYNSAVMANVVNVGTNPTSGSAVAGIRWYELRQDTTTKSWSIYQQGTWAPNDNVSRWDPGIAMDNNGSIGLEYTVSNPTSVYPGIRYTGRTACDTLGKMKLAETTVIAGNSVVSTPQGSGNRWGDYTKICIDPSDGVTFWATSMYANSSLTNSGNTGSRIFSFQVPKCTGPTGVASIEVPQTVLSAYQSGNMLNVMATKLPQGNNFYIEIFDIDGKRLTGKNAMPSSSEIKTTFDISSLANGIYFVRIANDSFQRVIKVAINK
ncbi:MAG TPA: T9SS type A sorting domain-containing protein, partial [Bacteroidia bacterium]|nr:T9SS type A sorting domain-containing protein [Bacteroidia bacterium]